ncbi:MULTISPECIES: 3-methyl-2-oxobutanoate hydroxymethyltransferase [unclassified Paenibacillus]|uniref:3-methyl-2-oxobutanoate hydroxymethyltransferase n=1 Tax=unclassified Paenibacillus TaxID=185978 RepID=UPI001AE42BC6|nr:MULTISPECIES: 3-methyl-2-oxobutanoate hydroxymethyltransferase [unclassified Paenibacillus]MBP1155298.1 3-methyl-2-oxobutanoate hydroxymethyltransferase [Paenibacillus sp. PvP091]MBP1169318.1 3-methyl-2-oxobutanoate hydroxymethyltransferase [Paenibacillus sp. PvR098]MBP2440346.1 3-methyl-2-oxobutanoate hydroxymethyltransferase [Paenibacillus sp. PvP052]
METRKPITTARLQKMKQDRVPISMITAYDYPSAILAEQAGIDVILVGDSLGNVVLGYDSTVPVTLTDMIYHAKAVTRAVQTTFVVTDLPFMTYHGSIDETLKNAARLMQEGLSKAVKMEGGAEIVPAVKALVQAGIPVMGHIGLTPQSIHQIGGYKIQGKTPAAAQKLLDDAKALEEAGAFGIVLELVTDQLAAHVTEQLSIPTIGIGAGAACDGQVLVFHDILGYGGVPHPKRFVKQYASIGDSIRSGIRQYVDEVKERRFPAPEHSFRMEEEFAASLYGSASSSKR